ncbi:MAG: glycosyltransferase family protein [Pseudolabrys sp.]|nr:glycosyltransferase family protein [Pseudolabrys sp.]
MPRTAIIVQARFASTRLPGKVLLDLAGETVLSHVLKRCRAAHEAALVCCATGAKADCDPIAAEAERCGVAVYRGAEHDVLDRYYQAARDIGADEIMRVTSDCPIIDPAICDDVIRLRRAKNVAYASNEIPPSWPHGLDCEVFTFDWLEKAAREAKKPWEREHVTLFIREHADVTTANLDGPGGAVVDHRWTLDNEADLRFFRALFAHMPQGIGSYSWKVPLAIVEAHPEIAAINAGQDRYAGLKKSMAEPESENGSTAA